MKEILKNKKGFTLIELLAVIVILAILVMVAIPAVTKILTDARKGTYADTAQAAIHAVREDWMINGTGANTATYTLVTNGDNKGDLVSQNSTSAGTLEKKLITSPFGNPIASAKVTVTISASGATSYKMCIWDSKGNGFELQDENSISKATCKLAGDTADRSCE